MGVGVTWIIGTNRVTGRVFIATSDGGRIDFDKAEAAHIAAALSEYERDNDTRAFVADEWGELIDD